MRKPFRCFGCIKYKDVYLLEEPKISDLVGYEGRDRNPAQDYRMHSNVLATTHDKCRRARKADWRLEKLVRFDDFENMML